jgi:hypothetical protein
VVYLDGDCDNMFGWGNFLFWPQVCHHHYHRCSFNSIATL